MRPQLNFSPAQVRAARGLLDLQASGLASLARIELEAIELYEAGEGELSSDDLARLGAALYASGVIAIPEKQAGEGVRFKSAFRGSGPLDIGGDFD